MAGKDEQADDVVFAKDTVGVAWSQGTTSMTKGDTWDANAPLVQERPDLFSRAPVKPIMGRIERATRAPGEVRGSGRRPA